MALVKIFDRFGCRGRRVGLQGGDLSQSSVTCPRVRAPSLVDRLPTTPASRECVSATLLPILSGRKIIFKTNIYWQSRTLDGCVGRGCAASSPGPESPALILPDVTILLRVMLRLGFSVVSDAERYPGGNGITSGSITRSDSPRGRAGPRTRTGCHSPGSRR